MMSADSGLTSATDIETQLAPEQEAWSAEPCDDVDDVDDDGGDYSWGAAAERASVMLMACVGAAVMVGLLLWVGLRVYDAAKPIPTAPTTMPAAALAPISSEPMSPPPSAAPPPTTVAAPSPTTVTVTASAPPPAAPPTTPKTAPPNADTVFRNLVRGIPGITVTNWDIAETGAHNICRYLRQGHTRDEAIQQVAQNDPTFLPSESAAMVDASVMAYCPQYGD
jgi:hypothetical protein